MEEENGKFLVVDASNIGDILEQAKKWSRSQPAQVMRPCFKCKQMMYNQAYCVILNEGVPEFYCEACAPLQA